MRHLTPIAALLLAGCERGAPTLPSAMPSHDPAATHVTVRLDDGKGGLTEPRRVPKVT
jgi:hypothetical protein